MANYSCVVIYDKRPENPAAGDLVARGRCPRCDKPLTLEVWNDGWDWCDAEKGQDQCASDGDIVCPGPTVDWRARALGAEALLAEALAELRTVEAVTVSPSETDGLMLLCNRIASACGQPLPFADGEDTPK